MRAPLLLAGLCCAAALAQRPEFVRTPPGALQNTRFDCPFWMGRTEVTVKQWEAFAKATGYRTVAERQAAARTWRTPGFKVSARQPVVHVSFNDAAAYCRWIGARLPTEAEWEYAARAGAATRHYWSDAVDGRYLWYRENSAGRPQPVARKLPNAWGLHDVEGNVWEWAAADPSPQGERRGSRRGGSWVACADIEPTPGRQPGTLIGLSTAYRVDAKVELRCDDIGFRCAR